MNMNAKNIRWVEPPATIIDETIMNALVPEADLPVKPILKLPRNTPFPFASEDDNKELEDQEDLNKTKQISNLLRNHFICIMKSVFGLIKMLINNQIITGFTNFLISAIAFISITALRIIAAVGRFLIDFDFSLFFESCLFLLEEHELYFTTDLSHQHPNRKSNKRCVSTTAGT